MGQREGWSGGGGEGKNAMHIITQHTTQGICVPYVNILWHRLHH